MTAPADALADLLGVAVSYRKAETPEAVAVALTLLAIRLGAALGCTQAEVKEQLELMRAPTPEVRMGTGHRKPKPPDDGLNAAIERVVNQLTLVQVKPEVPWGEDS